MKIKDLLTGGIFEYGTDQHHSLMISEDGRTLSFYNLHNGDGSRFGDYRFVMDDGETPEDSETPEALHGCAYFNFGGFNNPCWIPVTERLPEKSGTYLASTINGAVMATHFYADHKSFSTRRINRMITAWMPLPEPYKE